MSYPVANGAVSSVRRFKLLDSSSSTGAGLVGLTNASSGLIISTITDKEAAPVVYTVAASNVETIATLATYAAPSANKCRFKEVSATNHPGVYEFQFADSRFAVGSAKQLLISVHGATNLVQQDYEIPLDFQSALVPNAVNLAAIATDTGLKPTRTATAQGGASGSITLDAGASALTDFYKNNLIQILSGTGAGQSRFSSGYNGTTKVSLVTNPWLVTPDATSVFAIWPTDVINEVTLQNIIDGVLDAAIASHVVAGSVGKRINDTSLQATLLAVEADVDASLVVALKLDSALEVDGLVYRLTTNALEQGPTGSATPALVRAEIDANSTRLSAIQTRTDLIPGTQDGKTYAQTILLMAATLLGKSSGLGTPNAVYRAINDSKDRITATVDETGNRSAVTLDAT